MIIKENKLWSKTEPGLDSVGLSLMVTLPWASWPLKALVFLF